MKKVFSFKNILYRLFSTFLISLLFNDITMKVLVILTSLTLYNLIVYFVYKKYNKYNKFIDLTICLGLLLTLSIILTYNKYFDIYFGLGLILITSFLIYFYNEKIPTKINISSKLTVIIISIFTIISLIILGGITVYRYKTFSAPNYDLGIFSQMFEYMKNTFVPYTTLERSMMLSHFNVHLSLILYLILPIYSIFSSPITIQLMGTIIIISGIIPLIKSLKFKKIDNKIIGLISFLYLFCPIISTGMFFDFHENVFLLPILLWLNYFNIKNKNILLFVFLIGLLMVKEDACIYAFTFGLYTLFNNSNKKKSMAIMIISIVYFIIATSIINKYGVGIMMERYNSISTDGSILGILKQFFIAPEVLINEIFFSKIEFAKIKYIIVMFLPLTFIFSIIKKKSDWILFIPLLCNLLSGDMYQIDYNFHYSYGIIGLLFILIINNSSALTINNKLIFSVISTVCLYTFIVGVEFNIYVKKYYSKPNYYNKIEDILKTIPEDASITAYTFYTTHLYKHKVLYEDYYYDEFNTDYYIINAESYLSMNQELLNNNYILHERYEDMYIYKKKQILLD